MKNTMKFFLVSAMFTGITVAADARNHLDQPIPGTDGGTLSIHVASGKGENDFHVTYEKDGGYYVCFNGKKWSDPIQITQGQSYRSGYQMTIESDKKIHFVWGPENRGIIKYRALINDVLGAEQTVILDSRGESAITADGSGTLYIAATAPEGNVMAVHTKKPGGTWTMERLPRNESPGNRWSPGICITDGGKILVTYRHLTTDPRDHPTNYCIFENGLWLQECTVPGHKFKTQPIAVGEDFIFAAGNAPNTIDFIHLHAIGGGRYDTFIKRIDGPRGRIRGQRVGLAMTDYGTLVATHSNMHAPHPSTNKTIESIDRYFYSTSRDKGRSWITTIPVTSDTTGQGHGNVAVNGNAVMMVWPDMRDGLHVRYSLYRDGPDTDLFVQAPSFEGEVIQKVPTVVIPEQPKE